MKLAVPKEIIEGETRVALIPQSVKKFIKNVEVNGQNLGISIYFSTLTPNQNNTVTINGWVNL